MQYQLSYMIQMLAKRKLRVTQSMYVGIHIKCKKVFRLQIGVALLQRNSLTPASLQSDNLHLLGKLRDFRIRHNSKGHQDFLQKRHRNPGIYNSRPDLHNQIIFPL